MVEKLTGNQVTPDKLADAIRMMNGKRRALQRLARARRAHPSPISGKDALLVTQVSFYDDVARDTRQINALCDELDGAYRRSAMGVFPAKAPRILMSGCPMAIPNWKLHHLLESLGRRRRGRGILHRHARFQRPGS